MAKLYVTEIARLRRSPDGAQVADMATMTEQTPVVIGAGSLQSAAFGTDTRFVRVATDSICSIAYGSNPTATTNTFRMAADQVEYFGVQPGDKIAVIANT